MKKLIKATLKPLWRLSRPLREPLIAKFENMLIRCFRNAVPSVTDETQALMDHVIRALVRLERQVDALDQSVEDLANRQDRSPAIAGEIDPEGRRLGERSKAS